LASWFALVGAGLPACAGDAAPGDAAPPELEIGQGELSFERLADGEAVPYAAGAQGGHHVFVSFRMAGLDPARILVSVTTDVEGHPELALTLSGRIRFTAEPATDPARFVFAGWPAQILMAPCHVGALALIEVTLTDRDGRTAKADKSIKLARGDNPVDPCASDEP
jgi:hypothetical protein